jgi:methyltransferase-like protein/2-polyprenyl-3-methyl-5-hydroxy-6-metoxy-1,4-benzoquinol methylase
MPALTRRSSYDEVPYPSFASPFTTPDCLATVATLFGLAPPPVERCRVLELGCSDGGNLIPMACALPESTFVGVDSSAGEVGDGEATIRALGLANVTLRHQDILEVTPEAGPFDYIICHGIFSWVPEPVRDSILAICCRCLAPDGVAYVSYNTYPGWHLRAMIRDMMLYHTRRLADPYERAARARTLLDFLAATVPAGARGKENPYHALLQSELDLLRGAGDAYVVHEFLEDVNEPVYFHQFIERAARHGLQYLAEAEVGTMPMAPVLSRDLADPLDYVRLEQYLDFLRNRRFRQTLLCHRDMPVRRPPAVERLSRLYVCSPARPEAAAADPASPAPAEFRGPQGAAVSTDHRLAKAALLCLAESWPRAVPFETLVALAQARVKPTPAPAGDGGAPPGEMEALGQVVLRSYGAGLVHLRMSPPAAVGTVSERPVASALVRFQARRGPIVTNAFHEAIHVNDEVSRHLLQYLDGERDRAGLLDALLGLSAEGRLAVRHDGEPVADVDRLRSLLPGLIERSLRDLACQALLIG